MQMQMKRTSDCHDKIITVIIPNFNGAKFLKDCLLSLKDQSFKDFSVCVVDNGSDDESVSIMEKDFPEYVLIKLDENLGFAKAVNIGIRETSSEYVVLLNNDVVADKNLLENLYKAIDNKKSVFAYQAKMLSLYDRDKIDSAGDLYCALGWAFAVGKDKPARLYDRDSRIFSACAGAAIYRRELLEITGLFDERHFCYLEDVDLSFRARINGYSIKFCPKALVFHAGSGTTGSRHNEFKVSLSARNNIYLLYKNLPPLMLVLNLPLLIAGHIIKLCYFAKKGLAKAYLKGIKEGFGLCGKTPRYSFRRNNLIYYIKIQAELWVNTMRRITG